MRHKGKKLQRPSNSEEVRMGLIVTGSNVSALWRRFETMPSQASPKAAATLWYGCISIGPMQQSNNCSLAA
jgi:hypothetical protein